MADDTRYTTDNVPQPDTDFEPASQMVVDDLEALKVLADPLRLQILELMRERQTVKKIAARLDLPPTKLYYHINLLEKHGLIRLVDTRIVSGIIEKHYQVAARRFSVAKDLLSPEDPEFDQSIELTITGLFENAKQDIIQSIHDGAVDCSEDAPEHCSASIAQMRLTLTEEQAVEVYRRMSEIVEEFCDEDCAKPVSEGAKDYKLLYVLWPSSRTPDFAERCERDK